MVTMYDVAKEAGVSASTVSRVLNGKKTGVSITEETKARVFAAAKKLQYRPNRIAQNLRLQRSNCIGFLLCQRLLTHMFYYRMLKSVEKEVSRAGLNLIFATYDETEENPPLLKERTVDALLVTGKVTKDIIEKIEGLGIPFIVLGEIAYDKIDIPQVTYDLAASIAMPLEYLFSRGHTDIAYINDYHDDRLVNIISNAYHQTYHKAGISVGNDFLQCGVKEKDVYLCFCEFFKKNPEVTAVVIQQQFIKDFYRFAVENKLSIPEELSVIIIGDDIQDSQSKEFFHCVMTQSEEIGKVSVEHINNMLKGNNENVEIAIPPYISEGKSVKEIIDHSV